jgi:hypothetical protein
MQDLLKDVGGDALPSTEASKQGASDKQPKKRRVALRDGIDWEAVSRKLEMRDPKQCMSKWYKQLRPDMTVTNEWAIGDDAALLMALWRAKPEYVCDHMARARQLFIVGNKKPHILGSDASFCISIMKNGRVCL